MITLAGEILYHKHKESVEAKFKKLKPGATKVEAVKFPNEMSDMQQKRRMILSDDFSSYGMSRYPESDYRPTGPGKMMPRVSYISVFPRHRPVFNWVFDKQTNSLTTKLNFDNLNFIKF